MLNVNYPQRGGRGEGEIPPCAVSTESCAIDESIYQLCLKVVGFISHLGRAIQEIQQRSHELNLTDLKPFDTVIGLHIRSRAFLWCYHLFEEHQGCPDGRLAFQAVLPLPCRGRKVELGLAKEEHWCNVLLQSAFWEWGEADPTAL